MKAVHRTGIKWKVDSSNSKQPSAVEFADHSLLYSNLSPCIIVSMK